MNVTIYARFSPRPDKDKGKAVRRPLERQSESIEVQLDRCRTWCKVRGYTIVGECEDRAVSGKSVSDRPGLASAIAQALAGKHLLLVYSLSRASRSAYDAYQLADRLQRAGAALASVTEGWDTTTPTGRMVFGILAAIAEFEREITSERTSHAMIRKQREGFKVSSKPPYGYRIVGDRLVEEPVEMWIVGLIVERNAQGKSASRIARDLRLAGKTHRGAPWTAARVRRIIERNKE